MWTDNIDSIFLVNTSDIIGNQRLELSQKELSIKKIPPFIRYEAIIDTKNGANGLLMTMRKLFEENVGKNIMVFEDDILFLREDFNEIMELALGQLDKEYLCLYLGCNLLTAPVKVSDNLLKVMGAYSSHSVIYSKTCIDLMLTLWQYDKSFDMFLMQKVQPYGKSFCINPMLVSQRKGVSSIFEYVPEKQIGIDTYYNKETKEIDWGLMMTERFEMFTKNL